MPDRDLSPLLDALRNAVAADHARGVSDGELLRRFAVTRDPAAFELIVRRHGGLVRGVCRSVLRDEDAADDAFQAAFLVLLRKASTLRAGEALPSWLHRVALRTAMHARRSRRPASPLPEHLAADAEPSAMDADTARAVHEEIDRLPAKYRDAVVACFLEGHTHERAARLAGVPVGTMAGRVSRAKDILRRRLSRHGLEDVALVPVTAPAERAITGVMEWLTNLAGGTPVDAAGARVLQLAEGVIQAMWTSQLKWVAVAAMLVGVLGFGAGAAVVGGKGGETATETPVVAAAEEAPKVKPEAKKEAKDEIDPVVTRVAIRRNMAVIGGAVNEYGRQKRVFPSPAITDNEGKPLLSWRVAILPYLGHYALYMRFKLDEPWDGPNNKKLLDEMPDVFALPRNGATAKGHTYYQYVVGPRALFTRHRMTANELYCANGVPDAVFDRSGRGIGGGENRDSALMQYVRSGHAQFYRVLVAEAATPVPWTAPRDIEYDGKTPPALGGAIPGVFHSMSVYAMNEVIGLPIEETKPYLARLIDGTAPTGEIPGRPSIPWGKLLAAADGTGGTARRDALFKLGATNVKLKADLAASAELVAALEQEAKTLAWKLEAEAEARRDADTSALLAENAKLAKQLGESNRRSEKLLEELRRLRKLAEKK